MQVLEAIKRVSEYMTPDMFEVLGDVMAAEVKEQEILDSPTSEWVLGQLLIGPKTKEWLVKAWMSKDNPEATHREEDIDEAIKDLTCQGFIGRVINDFYYASQIVYQMKVSNDPYPSLL
jgi:hypothetical protein